MPDLRRRTVSLEAAPEGRARGVISTYGEPYEFAPRQREAIERGAFDLTAPIPVFYQHDHDSVPVGVAHLSDNETQLFADAQFFMDTERGRAAYAAMAAGALREWSVGFIVRSADDMVTTRSDGYTLDTIKRGDLAEVSVVLRGANPNTNTLEVRADGIAATTEVALVDAMSELTAALAKMHDALNSKPVTLLDDDGDDDADDGATPAEPANEPGAAERADLAELAARMGEPHVRAVFATLLH